jgi:hypothetical protein
MSKTGQNTIFSAHIGPISILRLTIAEKRQFCASFTASK